MLFGMIRILNRLYVNIIRSFYSTMYTMNLTSTFLYVQIWCSWCQGGIYRASVLKKKHCHASCFRQGPISRHTPSLCCLGSYGHPSSTALRVPFFAQYASTTAYRTGRASLTLTPSASPQCRPFNLHHTFGFNGGHSGLPRRHPGGRASA